MRTLWLQKPSTDILSQFVAEQSALDFSYSAVGATAETPPVGFIVDRTRIELVAGESVFEAAKSALQRWQQFRLGWVEAWSPETPLEVGQTVAIMGWAVGFWWLKPQPLFDFTGADAAKEWQPVNDGVMGGDSEGRFRITDEKTMEFFGTLSLENNGGFASVRTRAKKLGLQQGDTIVAKVRGDGREYSLNLYLNKPLIAFSYRATVQTKKDEWIEVKVPLDKFEATSFGRVVKDAGAVKPEEVNALGFMLSDKKAGPFKLEVESIRVVRSQE